MKTYYTLIISLCTTLAFQSMAQERQPVNGFDNVRSELTAWDGVRGPWLASSMEAMANKGPVPNRNFPESFTPHQMLRKVPADVRSRIQQTARNERNNGNQVFWSDIDRYVSSVNCRPRSGRTYGDPHMVSYDGARYSFQTVGEFVLTKSSRGDMEVQTRQRAMGDEFSLNTAVAMNVAGDRVAIYSRDYPDGTYNTPVRLNGKPVHMNGSTYFLNHGGTIKKSGNKYHVYWPTGETVTAEMRSSRNFDFMNITVQVPSCTDSDYTGLMGNANGSRIDDFNAGGVSPPFVVTASNTNDASYWERERQAYMAKQFGEVHRITQEASLFDYGYGNTTETFTDRSYPRVYPKFDDMNPRRLERSRRYCESMGVSAADMNGCMYDRAFLGLEASTPPIVPDPSEGTVLRPTSGTVENVNPPTDRPRPTYSDPTEMATPNKGTPSSSSERDPGTTTERPTTTTRPTTTERPTTTTRPTTSRPPTTTRPTTTRPPVSTPRPTPTPRPVTTPRPVSTPRPSVSRPPSTPRPASTPRPSGGIRRK